MNKIYFATGNKGKIGEAQKILNIPIGILDIELDEIQDLDLKKIIKHKVEQAYELVKAPVFVDDVSVEIEAWQGFPGPFIKWLRKNEENKLLLHMMRNETNRNLKIIATIGYYDGAEVRYFTGSVDCELANEDKGLNGWGLDPVLIPKGYDKTWAEMSVEEKNSMSHRRLALDEFRKFLNIQP